MFAVERYPKAIRELLLGDDAGMPLDAGVPNDAAQAQLEKLRPADLTKRGQVADAGMAAAGLAGLWLLHNFLDDSHRLSQELHTPTGSFWHAIMHRREGDYDNSKYWFRQAGTHPAYAVLRKAARTAFVRESSAASASTRAFAPLEVLTLLDGDAPWDPYTFVNLCKAACNNRADLVKPCRHLQMLEWRALFDFCFQRAGGE